MNFSHLQDAAGFAPPRPFDESTLAPATLERGGVIARDGALVLTLLWHPHAWRLGEQAVLAPAPAWEINRFAPLFAQRADARAQPLPLLHAGVSRSSLVLRPDAQGLLVEPAPTHAALEVDGRPVCQPLRLTWERVERGVVLQPCPRVLLLLRRGPLSLPSEDEALLGVSEEMQQLRQRVRQVADTELPVLIHGETGTGKELVAQALHRGSRRRERPWVALNMATLGEQLAAAELFGAARGAYTGAQTARPGLWAEAEGGTLFLDEIGDCPATVQPMLLRVIETAEYRPLGSTRALRSDVRLVAATDRPLDAAHFNQPLLRRLQTFTLRTPALRQRREDTGVLARRMWRMHGGDDQALGEVPGALARALCLHAWPGNVRQLGQAVLRLYLGARMGGWPDVAELLSEPLALPAVEVQARPAALDETREPLALEVRPAAAAPPPAGTAGQAPPRTRRRTDHVSAEALLAALDLHGWELEAAARELGVSRPSMYNLLARHPVAGDADRLQREALAARLDSPGVSLSGLARSLRVPKDALRRRLKALGLPRPADD